MKPGGENTSLKAATLAVGTEVTDGQILDRNSAWISAQLVASGLQVIEHRAVADCHADIERALRELAERVDLLFVTGGLGPTSDDFTRDILSRVFARPLEFDEDSWLHLSGLLNSRGIQVSEIQRRQCYFPVGATVLTNPAGTANAFCFDEKKPNSDEFLRVVALPGPPSEVAAVWELNLRVEIEKLLAAENRDELLILRCIGRGESQVAEATEPIIAGSGIRVGYRAHVPYVEVKLWCTSKARAKAAGVFRRLEAELQPWLVNRNQEDVADSLIDRALNGERTRIVDAATGGLLSERLQSRIRERKLFEASAYLVVESHLIAPFDLPLNPTANGTERVIFLSADVKREVWSLRDVSQSCAGSTVEIPPAFNYKLLSDRGRRFICEKAMFLLGLAKVQP